MNSRERIQTTLNHQEPDRIPYDLADTTVTAITKNAYLRAMQLRGYSKEIGDDEIDPIQQIITPSDENLLLLKSDTRRLGAKRIADYRNKKRVSGNIIEVTDFYGSNWRFEQGKDIYFHLIDSSIEKADFLSGSLHLLPQPDWDSYIYILRDNLNEQIEKVSNFCGIADRNTAGLTENSLRIRGYENWFMDTMIDAGLDILNPVQFTAAGMDLRELKRDFGDTLTFWGGGVDTQSTLNNGNPQKVADEVKRVIDILAPGGGFVFAPVHNIQYDVPPENFWAM